MQGTARTPDETDPVRSVAPRGPSYGWVVVGIAFLTQFLLTGCVFYSFSVALTVLADEFGGGDRTGVSLAQAALMPFSLLLSPVVAGSWAAAGFAR